MSTVIQSEPFVQKFPRSALRHRPIQTQAGTQDITILKPRASQAKPSQVSDAHTMTPRRNRIFGSGTWLIYLVLGMCVSMLLLSFLQNLWNWGNTAIEDIRYGRPRTTQVDHFVGHETGNIPSHFIAINLKGQVYVIEIPGGSPSTSHLLMGPHLYGEASDLAPITISFAGNLRHPDLLITIENIQVHFHNTGKAYAPAP